MKRHPLQPGDLLQHVFTGRVGFVVATQQPAPTAWAPLTSYTLVLIHDAVVEVWAISDYQRLQVQASA